MLSEIQQARRGTKRKQVAFLWEGGYGKCSRFETCLVLSSTQREKLYKMLETLQVTLRSDDRELVAKQLLKRVMQLFLPAADALLEMIVIHLPSPAKAQKYRVENLYTGASELVCLCDTFLCKGTLNISRLRLFGASSSSSFTCIDVTGSYE